jgi:hypothetical protein
VDGALQATAACANQALNYGSGPRGQIGWKTGAGTNDDFNGIIDEARVSNIIRTGAWITTEYNNQSAPSTFFSLSPEQTLYPAVAEPAFTLTAGIYTSPQTVAISTTTGGATINYTTDGSTPTEGWGNVYTTPITVSASQTIQAMAFAPNMTDSLVASAAYTITGTVSQPTISPAPGAFTTSQTITLTPPSAQPGASIQYSLNGGAWINYTGPFLINATTTIFAEASQANWLTSPPLTSSYTIPPNFTISLSAPPPPP